MKKMMLFFLSMLIVPIGFATHFVLDNQVTHSMGHQKSNLVVQWATSAKDIEASHHKIRQGTTLARSTFHVVAQTGKIKLEIPKKALYFRVLSWDPHLDEPDFFTNWVDIVPNKTYTLHEEDLVPAALMLGTGC